MYWYWVVCTNILTVALTVWFLRRSAKKEQKRAANPLSDGHLALVLYPPGWVKSAEHSFNAKQKEFMIDGMLATADTTNPVSMALTAALVSKQITISGYMSATVAFNMATMKDKSEMDAVFSIFAPLLGIMNSRSAMSPEMLLKVIVLYTGVVFSAARTLLPIPLPMVDHTRLTLKCHACDVLIITTYKLCGNNHATCKECVCCEKAHSWRLSPALIQSGGGSAPNKVADITSHS